MSSFLRKLFNLHRIVFLTKQKNPKEIIKCIKLLKLILLFCIERDFCRSIFLFPYLHNQMQLTITLIIYRTLCLLVLHYTVLLFLDFLLIYPIYLHLRNTIIL